MRWLAEAVKWLYELTTLGGENKACLCLLLVLLQPSHNETENLQSWRKNTKYGNPL